MGEPPTSAARSAASPRPSASPSQPIVDLSPIKRSASSLTPQSHHEVELRDYDLEHAGQSPVGPGQEEERVHHHHHHHRCHRRRDKDREKKHRSLEKAASVQPGSTTGEADKTLVRYLKQRLQITFFGVQKTFQEMV